jgi:hypothetical protein
MDESNGASRRRVLAGFAALASAPLVGCLDGSGTDDADEANASEIETETTDTQSYTTTATPVSIDDAATLGTTPYPSTLVGNEEFPRELRAVSEQERFPDPDADLVPELTKARFVAEAARSAGNDDYASRVSEIRDPLFEPLLRFDAAAVLMSESRREQYNESQIKRVLNESGLDERGVTANDSRAQLYQKGLDRRTLTFFDYPGSPVHFIPGAARRGRELMRTTHATTTAADESRRTYLDHRRTVTAIVVGARDLGARVYPKLEESGRSTSRSYQDADAYAEVIAFNAALAGESMLESDGELIQGP